MRLKSRSPSGAHPHHNCAHQTTLPNAAVSPALSAPPQMLVHLPRSPAPAAKQTHTPTTSCCVPQHNLPHADQHVLHLPTGRNFTHLPPPPIREECHPAVKVPTVENLHITGRTPTCTFCTSPNAAASATLASACSSATHSAWSTNRLTSTT